MTPPIVLLHGALGAAPTLAPLATVLADAGLADVHACELPGHGATPLADDAAFAIAPFAAHVRAWMDARGLARAALFGYSMGGYVALHLAAAHPERVAAVCTLGTKLAWTPDVAAREASRLDPATLRAKVPRFADALAARHAGAGGWEAVCARTAALLRALGDAPPLTPDVLAAIAVPARLMLGDRDTTVTLDETAAAMRALPQGELAVLPRTPHPLEQADPARLAFELRDLRARLAA
jgi:pimeloyl-ACP methyl ester carboxylesterase